MKTLRDRTNICCQFACPAIMLYILYYIYYIISDESSHPPWTALKKVDDVFLDFNATFCISNLFLASSTYNVSCG